jgi:hypothetical protein
VRAFAEWVSSRRYRGALVATVFGLFAPLAVPSAGVIVLAALRHGAREALLVLVAATFFLALARTLTGLDARAAIAFSAGLWLPAVGVAHLLRRSGSLSLCLQVTVVGAGALALFVYAAGDPVGQVQTFIGPIKADLEQALGTPLEGEALTALSRAFTALLFGATVATLTCGLLLGRWWERLLGSGGFGAEFRTLRMGRVLALAGAVVLAAYVAARAPVLESLLCVIGAGFVFQGLAVMHAAAFAQGLHVGWLVALYAALIITAFYAAAVVAAVGWLDTWFDLRARLNARASRR